MRARKENITDSVRMRDPRYEPSDEEAVESVETSASRPVAEAIARAPGLEPFSLAPAPAEAAPPQEAPRPDEGAAPAPAGRGATPVPSGSDPTLAVAPPHDGVAASRAVITSADPRLTELEALFAKGDWDGIRRRLGSPDQIGQLPPTLGLIYAVAWREAEGDEGASGASALAIRCAASLFGVPPESSTALVLAKRLLRKNPAAWRSRPAPPRRISALIMVVALLVGAGVGLLTGGKGLLGLLLQ
jgi:hypothetical protein